MTQPHHRRNEHKSELKISNVSDFVSDFDYSQTAKNNFFVRNVLKNRNKIKNNFNCQVLKY